VRIICVRPPPRPIAAELRAIDRAVGADRKPLRRLLWARGSVWFTLLASAVVFGARRSGQDSLRCDPPGAISYDPLLTWKTLLGRRAG